MGLAKLAEAIQDLRDSNRRMAESFERISVVQNPEVLERQWRSLLEQPTFEIPAAARVYRPKSPLVPPADERNPHEMVAGPRIVLDRRLRVAVEQLRGECSEVEDILKIVEQELVPQVRQLEETVRLIQGRGLIVGAEQLKQLWLAANEAETRLTSLIPCAGAFRRSTAAARQTIGVRFDANSLVVRAPAGRRSGRATALSQREERILKNMRWIVEVETRGAPWARRFRDARKHVAKARDLFKRASLERGRATGARFVRLTPATSRRASRRP